MKMTLVKQVKSPIISTDGSAGIDMFVPTQFPETTIKPNQSILIPSGVKMEIPKNNVLIAFNKSGIAISGLQVGACVIDHDYQGEIHLHLFNVSDKPITIKPDQKLVQFILLPYIKPTLELVEEIEMFFEPSQRGNGAFGSTNDNLNVEYESPYFR
jgi:dUTP pyrophosphatase